MTRCYLLARYDVDKNLELSQGCSTRQVSLKQHECETQVRLVSAVTWSIGPASALQTSRNVREIVCYCNYNYCNAGDTSTQYRYIVQSNWCKYIIMNKTRGMLIWGWPIYNTFMFM